MTSETDTSTRKTYHRKTPTWLCVLTWFYVAFLTALSALDWYGPDSWWFGDVNLFLPQVIWLIPGICLACISMAVARRWLWIPVLCIVWVLGPIMDFHWRFGGSPDSAGGQLPIRVMTCNVKYGNRTISALVDDITRNAPDIVILQDVDAALMNTTFAPLFAKWNVRIRDDNKYVVASRYPLGPATASLIPYRGEPHSCLRCQVHIGPVALTVYDVHFASPREGLYGFTSSRRQPATLPKAIQDLKANQEDRFSQARALGEMVRHEPGPVIVAGDLNSADFSLVCKTLRGAGLHDSFAEGGRGYGYTYGHYLLRHKFPWLTYSWMRIDHIMVSPHLESLRCWTGNGEASDHRPVFADLVLKYH